MVSSYKKSKSKKLLLKKTASGRTSYPGDEYASKTRAAGKSYLLGEPDATYNTRIRTIGNSNGVILTSQLIKAAGMHPDADIVVQAHDGVIIIIEAKHTTGINTDLSTWDSQFKTAIKAGNKPEKDLFEGMKNDFDIKEW